MTKTRFLTALISKLIGIRVFVRTEIKDANKHPENLKFVVRLDGFLRVTQEELLEAFGVKTRDKLPVNIQSAVAVVSRIFRGKDSYRVIAEKAEVLIKRLHPLHVAELERIKLEAAQRVAREAILTRFHALSSRTHVVPDGITTAQLSDLVSDLRDELEAKTQHLMDEVNELALRHPDVSRISDKNLLAFASRLEARRAVIKPVRTSLAPKLRQAVA